MGPVAGHEPPQICRDVNGVGIPTCRVQQTRKYGTATTKRGAVAGDVDSPLGAAFLAAVTGRSVFDDRVIAASGIHAQRATV